MKTVELIDDVSPIDLNIEEIAKQDPNYAELDSTLEHVENFSEGFESIIAQYRSKGFVDYSGNESYAVGVLKANGYNKGIEHGFENFITSGLSKLWEMIKSMCKSIWEFFFGRKDSNDTSSPEDDKKAAENIVKKVEKIEKTGEAPIPEDKIQKAMKKGVEDAIKNKPAPTIKHSNGIGEAIGVKIVDARSAEHALEKICELHYEIAAHEAAKKKLQEEKDAKKREEKAKEMLEEINKKKWAIESTVTRDLTQKLYEKIKGYKRVDKLLKDIMPYVDKMVKLEEEYNEHTENELFPKAKWIFKAGTFWSGIKRDLEESAGKNWIDGNFLIYPKTDKEYFKDITKFYSESPEKDEAFKGKSEAEVQQMVSKARNAIQYTTHVIGKLENGMKVIRQAHENAFRTYAQQHAKLLAAELSKAGLN